MRKFKVTVTHTIEYEVTIDESLWNEDLKEYFERSFWELPEGESAPESFAKGLAEQTARMGMDEYIEGFGTPATSEKTRREDNTVGLYICSTD